MNVILLVLCFLLLLFIGMPIAYDLGIISLLGIVLLGGVPLVTVAQKMFSGLNSFILLAVPLFILAANLMNRGGISAQLVEVAIAMVGHFKGGLGHANVLVSMIFAGISGSSQADTAGIGKILIPSMEKNGYSKEEAVGVTAASSTIGVIIPPSIPMVIYGSLASASVGALFLGGIIPGILIGLAQMFIVHLHAKKYNYPSTTRVPLLDVLKMMIKYLPSLITPVIIIGGVVLGLVTPTEAAAVGCVYALILGCVVFKTIKLRDLPGIFIETITMTAQSLFALATATALGQLLSYYNVSRLVEQFFSTYHMNWIVFLILTILFFLFLGTFMDAIPAMTLFVPVLLPVATAIGVTPIHFGLVVVITLAIGLITPPYGICLLIAGAIAKLPVERSFSAVMPYLIAILFVLLLVAFFPDIVLFFPKLLRPEWF
ncbi:TRAP transporter large permease [Murdochiella massiliensis]|uniref:TRAP transporter large permease n=1 Tax=Murdochiella massiliensis TaxID=1673723 RepID=UPI00083174B5|nr:TRAP transporter large permease [Murdochiella massiliensis]